MNRAPDAAVPATVTVRGRGKFRSIGVNPPPPVTDFLRIRDGLSVPISEIEIRASRSSGPGGQHANVTASRIEAVFDVRASSVLSDAQKARIAPSSARA